MPDESTLSPRELRTVMRARLRPWACVRLAGGLVAGLVAVAACADRQRASDTTAARAAPRAPDDAFRARLGVTWELARLGTQEIPPTRLQPTPPGADEQPGPASRPTIMFTAEPREQLSRRPGTRAAGGRSFCNGYGTSYELGPGDGLRFYGFESTLVGCDGPDSLETRFFRALANTRRFELDSTTLNLVAEDGSRLAFVASSGGAAAK